MKGKLPPPPPEASAGSQCNAAHRGWSGTAPVDTNCHYIACCDGTKSMSITRRIKSDLARNLEPAALPCLVCERHPPSPSSQWWEGLFTAAQQGFPSLSTISCFTSDIEPLGRYPKKRILHTGKTVPYKVYTGLRRWLR